MKWLDGTDPWPVLVIRLVLSSNWNIGDSERLKIITKLGRRVKPRSIFEGYEGENHLLRNIARFTEEFLLEIEKKKKMKT